MTEAEKKFIQLLQQNTRTKEEIEQTTFWGEKFEQVATSVRFVPVISVL